MARPYPMTILPTRYGGIYEGGREALYAAFLCDPWDVPQDAFGGDLVAAEWWEPVKRGSFPQHPRFPDVPLYVAVGHTANAAEERLRRLLDEAGAPSHYR